MAVSGARQQTELHRIFVTRCIRAARANRFTKIGRLTVNRVLDVHDDYRAISSARLNLLFPKVPKPARPHVQIGLQMIKHPTDGLLFFDGGRELRIVAYDVSRADAVVHADGLGLLPINFYITFDDFLTVGKCRLAWRCRDDIGVVFERWLDIPRSVSSSTKHADLSPPNFQNGNRISL